MLAWFILEFGVCALSCDLLLFCLGWEDGLLDCLRAVCCAVINLSFFCVGLLWFVLSMWFIIVLHMIGLGVNSNVAFLSFNLWYY